jgi:hypothetical protein
VIRDTTGAARPPDPDFEREKKLVVLSGVLWGSVTFLQYSNLIVAIFTGVVICGFAFLIGVTVKDTRTMPRFLKINAWFAWMVFIGTCSGDCHRLGGGC